MGTDSDISALTAACTAITSINFSGCKKITDAVGITALFFNCIEIIRVNLQSTLITSNMKSKTYGCNHIRYVIKIVIDNDYHRRNNIYPVSSELNKINIQ